FCFSICSCCRRNCTNCSCAFCTCESSSSGVTASSSLNSSICSIARVRSGMFLRSRAFCTLQLNRTLKRQVRIYTLFSANLKIFSAEEANERSLVPSCALWIAQMRADAFAKLRRDFTQASQIHPHHAGVHFAVVVCIEFARDRKIAAFDRESSATTSPQNITSQSV